MVEYTDEELLIIGELKRYVPPKDYGLNDWRTIISRVEEVKPNVFKYHLHDRDIYLDYELFIVAYDKVHIIKDEVYYDFNTSEENSGTYTYIGKVNYG